MKHIRIMNILVLLLALVPVPVIAAAEAEREKNYEISITKGTLMIETGDYAEAVLQLKRALEAKAGDKAATQALGIAYARWGNFRAAKEALLKALAIDTADWRTRYELGAASLSLGEADAAKKYFQSVVEGSDDEALVSGARRYLDLIAASSRDRPRPFQLSVLAGLQYDSNVILEPSNPAASAEKRSDWSAVASAGILYPFLREKGASAEAGYTVYQSVHDRLHAFNVQQHALALGGRFTTGTAAETAASYQYTYSLVGGHRFSSVHRLSPMVTLKPLPTQSVDLFYAFESRAYSNGDDFPQNSDRNGADHAVGAVYRIDVSRGLSVQAGFTHDRDSASKEWWSSTGNKASVGVNGDIAGIKAAVSLSLYDQRYNGLFPGFTGKRHDRVQELSLQLVKEFTKRISVMASELYVRNRSNIGPFDYTRNITGIFAVIAL